MKKHTLGIDIGSTTVKIAILDENDTLVFSDYERHFANIQETLADLLQKAEDQLGELTLCPVITGSGGLTLANHLEVPFVQEVIASHVNVNTFPSPTNKWMICFPNTSDTVRINTELMAIVIKLYRVISLILS